MPARPDLGPGGVAVVGFAGALTAESGFNRKRVTVVSSVVPVGQKD